MRIFIKNIKKLINVRENTPSALSGEQLGVLPCIEDAYLITDGDSIIDFGEMSEIEKGQLAAIEQSVDKVIDATGRMVFPSYCDSHTHLVYAGSREMEFSDKLRGLSYQEIARRGGGILNSVALLHNTSEDSLLEQTLVRAKEIISMGTGAERRRASMKTS